MVSYKLDKYDRFFIAFVCVLVVIFNLGTLVFASEENVDVLENVDTNLISGLVIRQSSNFFNVQDSSYVSYFELEDGYIYHITNKNGVSAINLVVSSNLPAANVPYTYLISLPAGQTYDYIGSGYIYFSASGNSSNSTTLVTREKQTGLNSAITDLVDNVGINNFWSVFEGGIDFVGVVVLVAFGLFLVVLAIKKVSKGKSEF